MMRRTCTVRGIRQQLKQQQQQQQVPPSGRDVHSEKRLPISAYGSDLKGYGSTASIPMRIPTPMEAWLSCVGMVMPFHGGRTMIVTPASAGRQTWGSLQSQLGMHFPKMEHRPLSEPKALIPELRREGRVKVDPDFVFPKDDTILGNNDDVMVDEVSKELVSSGRNDIVAAPLPSVTLPLGNLATACADGVIFTNGAFAEVVHESPRVISDVHRVLKPRGVMCIVDHQLPRIVCGDTGVMADVATDFKDFCEVVRSNEYLSIAEQSTACAHMDTYLPFAAVNRRAFTSEFEVSLKDFIRYIETWPCFRKAMTPIVGADGTHRKRLEGEPLEMFEWCTSERLRRDGSPQRLRISVDHFVLSCSNRAFEVHDAIGEERNFNFPL